MVVNEEEFYRRLEENNPHFNGGYFSVLGKYTSLSNYILVKKIYGVCRVSAESLTFGTKPCILSAVDKNKYFENYLREVNPDIFDGYFKILSEFKGFNKKVFIQDKYGICNPYASNLRTDKTFKKIAVNREGYLKNYIYDNNSHIKKGDFTIENICGKWCYISNDYGIFKLTISSLCTKNSAGKLQNCLNPEYYCIKKFREVHGNRYNYSKFVYKGSSKKSTVICKIHGDFEISYDKHSLNRGCYYCGKERVSKIHKEKGNGWSPKVWEHSGNNSENFSGFKFYLIKCWDDKEEFYKIGKTYTTVNKRYRVKSSMPYKYKKIISYTDSADRISRFEMVIKSLLKDNSYNPTIPFNGISECFKFEDENELINIIHGKYTTLK